MKPEVLGFFPLVKEMVIFKLSSITLKYTLVKKKKKKALATQYYNKLKID